MVAREMNTATSTSIQPIELDATITALGNIWLQSFLQLHNPNTTDEDVIATAAAASALLRQVLRLSREQTTIIISQEQLRHIKKEDATTDTVSQLVSELRTDIGAKFDSIHTLLQPIANSVNAITEQLTNHDTRITQLEHDMQLLKGYLHD
jgi:molybdopterin converting factor small subunit